MNLEPPPQPAQPHPRVAASCPRHPDLAVTGFCASCLRERLLSLEQQNSQTSTTTTTSSSAAAAARLKAIFRPSSSSSSDAHKPTTTTNNNTTSARGPSLLPELRRSKSFSAAGRAGEGLSGAFEPQRRSCDVRVRSTLWSLFNQDSGAGGGGGAVNGNGGVENTRVLGVSSSKEEEIRVSNVSVGCLQETVQEVAEEEEEEEIEEVEEEEELIREEDLIAKDEIQVEIEEEVEEIQELEPQGSEKQQQQYRGVEEEEEEVKKMKDHIDQETQGKKPPGGGGGRDLKEIAGSFLFAASAFGRKWQNWRRKHKSKKLHNGRDATSTTMQVDKPYSEIADYGFGRRSCDTDPRFSLDAARDAARMSFDDPRYSWDEPRASWDGYLIGRTFPKMAPMVSVVEDAPVVPVQRSDNQIPVEEPRNSVSETDIMPGGSLLTKEYYSDSQRRRKSFERSNSTRKKGSGVIGAEGEEGKGVIGNAKEVSPTSSDQVVQGPKLVVTDRDWRDSNNSNSNSNSLREDYSGSLESGFKDSASVCGGIERKGSKKSRRWSKPWNIWALIYRRNGSKDEDEERYHRGNVVERSFSESWQELRREPNGDSKGAFNRVFRSNSSVSARHSFSSVKSCAEANGNGKKRRDEFVLERNRSARYSPTNIDNGLLRFYLAPTNRRNGSVKGGRPKNSSHSITNSVLRLY